MRAEIDLPALFAFLFYCQKDDGSTNRSPMHCEFARMNEKQKLAHGHVFLSLSEVVMHTPL